jgi:hypothetical protein
MKAKKMFRRPLATLLAIVMFIQLGGMTFAAGDEVSVEIVFSCDIDCQKAQLIANLLLGEPATSDGFIGISPASITCTLFGHSMAQTNSITTEHRFFPNAPRCRRTTHRVDYCTRSNCDHAIMTLISQVAMHCCA